MMTPINDDDYENLLEEYRHLHEDLEFTMDLIDLMMRDLTFAAKEVNENLAVIDRRLIRCRIDSRRSYKTKSPKNMSFQGSYHVPGPKTRQT